MPIIHYNSIGPIGPIIPPIVISNPIGPISPIIISPSIPIIHSTIIDPFPLINIGIICSKCNEFFQFSEPNQPNNSFICYSCRTYP